jgi:GT2 family glycosyltransferase
VGPTLSIVILSYNRCAALRRTLTELRAQGLLERAQVIVADNRSDDGSEKMVREEFPGALWNQQPFNQGVKSFNDGADHATGEVLLLLDDDSWPDAAALPAAMDLLAREPRVAAVALLPVHPGTGVAEWGAGGKTGGGCVRMGCGNLVRTEAWKQVGGYEGGFFLYRNDTDLALKLLSAGHDVWFDPAWIVWHDSPAAQRKSERWLRMATRNWGWLARRHGRGPSKWWGMLAGFARAACLAGLSVRRQWRVLVGAVESLRLPAPKLPEACRVDGRAFAKLAREQVAAALGPKKTKGAQDVNRSSMARHSP